MTRRSPNKGAWAAMALGALALVGGLGLGGAWLWISGKMSKLEYKADLAYARPTEGCKALLSGGLGALLGGGLDACSAEIATDVRVQNPLPVPLEVQLKGAELSLGSTKLDPADIALEQGVVVVAPGEFGRRRVVLKLRARELMSAVGGFALTRRLRLDAKLQLEASALGGLLQQQEELRVERSLTLQDIVKGIDGQTGLE